MQGCVSGGVRFEVLQRGSLAALETGQCSWPGIGLRVVWTLGLWRPQEASGSEGVRLLGQTPEGSPRKATTTGWR